MTAVQRSFFFSSVERYASLVLTFFSTAILARLLTPGEFGVYAVVGAVTAVVSASFSEMGGANYLIQKSVLSKQDVRTAFTLNLSLSLAFGALLCLLAGLIGAWFGVHGVASGLRVAALGFVISPFLTTLLALFRRDLHFGVISASNLINNIASAGVSIWLAILGYSYMSPLWGQFAGAAVQTAFLLRAHRNFGVFRPSTIGAGEALNFGLYSFGVAVINVVYNTAPQLFLARVLDFSAIGLYSRAVGVTQLFDRLVIQAISPVIMPAILAKKRVGGDLDRIYLDACSLLSALQWPFLLLIAFLAEPVIRIWLGPSWLPAAPLVRIYCVASLSLFAASLSYPVLVAAGGVRDALTSSLISLPPSLIIIFAASFLGIEAVTSAALITLPFQAAVAIYFIGRRIQMRFIDFFLALRKSAIVACCSGATAALGALAIHMGLLRPIAGVAISCCLSGAAWLGALIAVNHPLLTALRDAAASAASVVRNGVAVRLAQRHI
jgi:O-antigen/teichoic acid export membrane protein